MHSRRASWARDAAVTAIAAAVAAVAFLLATRVPLLGLFDLGIHELGHLVASPLPTLVMFLAGSLAQVAFPLAMAAYFFAGRRDLAAAGFCLTWAGASARDVSVYAADARVQALPLIGGEHDWAYILGPNGFDALEHTATVARTIEAVGAVLAVTGITVGALAVRRAWDHRKPPRRVTTPPALSASVPSRDPWA